MITRRITTNDSDSKSWQLTTTIAILLLFLSSACNTGTQSEVGTKVTANYTAPATYWDHRAQQQYFETQDGRIAFTDHGEGDVLVLLHGVPTNSWMYRKMIPDLQKSMRVITVDFMGYGSSDKPDKKSGAYGNAQQAANVQALLADLNIENYSILMHDMGGLVAWEALRNDPQAIDNLIVLNTIINKQGFDHPNIEPGFFTNQMMKAYSSELTSAVILKKTFDDLGLTGEYELTEAECHGYVAPIREGSDSALYAFFTNINDDLFSRLEENRILFTSYKGNTHIVWGGRDEILTTEQIPILQQTLSIPDDHIHIMPANAHFLAEEIPDELVSIVTSIVGR